MTCATALFLTGKILRVAQFGSYLEGGSGSVLRGVTVVKDHLKIFRDVDKIHCFEMKIIAEIEWPEFPVMEAYSSRSGGNFLL